MRPLTLIRDAGNMATYASGFFPPDFRQWRVYVEEMVVTLQIAQRIATVGMRFRKTRVEGNGGVERGQRVLCATEITKHNPAPEMRLGEFRPQCDRLLRRHQRLHEAPQLSQHDPAIIVRVGKIGLQAHGLGQ